MSIDGFLEQAAELGAEVVQLCENTGVDRLDDRALRDLAGLARRLNLKLECGSSGGRRGQLEAGIRRTARLDGTLFRCVLDSDGLEPQAVIANLQGVLPLLRDSGVVLCAENHFRFSPKVLRRIVEQVDDPAVAVCLDPLNSIAQLVGPDEAVRELIALTRTAHVKDARITRSGTGWSICGTPLGEGQLDLAAYLAAVATRAESLLIEAWMHPLDAEQGTLEQESAWARSSLAFVKEVIKGSRR